MSGLIVADSGPLIVFARSDLLPLVHQVAGEIRVPAAVFQECTREAAKPGTAAIRAAHAAGLFRVEADPDPELRLPQVAHLDAGEIEALTLARLLRCPVLMDERLGRQVAAQLRIPVVGSVGILLMAKETGHTGAVAPLLERWRSWGYFLAPDLLRAVLVRAGEAE